MTERAVYLVVTSGPSPSLLVPFGPAPSLSVSLLVPFGPAPSCPASFFLHFDTIFDYIYFPSYPELVKAFKLIFSRYYKLSSSLVNVMKFFSCEHLSIIHICPMLPFYLLIFFYFKSRKDCLLI